MVPEETQEKTEVHLNLATRVHPVPQAHPDRPDHLVHPETPDQMLQTTLQSLDPPDPLETRAPLDHPDPTADLATPATTAAQVPMVPQELPVPLDPPAPKDPRDHPVRTEDKERRVSARNTALWMAACFSRMARRRDLSKCAVLFFLLPTFRCFCKRKFVLISGYFH